MPRFIYTSIIYPALLLLGGIPLSAQAVALQTNMVRACAVGGTVVSLPVGTVYQFGANSGTGAAFTPPATSTAATVPLSIQPASFPFDPAPGAAETLWVQKAAVTYAAVCAPTTGNLQTILVAASGATPPPPPTNTTITLAADGSCKQTGPVATGSLILSFSPSP